MTNRHQPAETMGTDEGFDFDDMPKGDGVMEKMQITEEIYRVGLP